MKKHLSLYLILTLFTVFSSFAQASRLQMEDVSGRPIKAIIYENVTGSPYLSTNWITGKVILEDTRVYDNVNLKYDQLKDELIFEGKDGASFVVDHVKEFRLAPHDDVKDTTIFKSGFPAFKSNTVKSFYEVLEDGKVKLLKRVSKVVNSSKEFNSATLDKNIVPFTLYYLVTKSGELTIISKDKKSVFKVLADKSTELNTFLENNKLNLKNDEDLSKLITYYNGL